MRLRALLRVVDFFIPVDVLSAVLLVFTLENVLDYYFGLYISSEAAGPAWLAVYVVGIVLVSLLNVLTADDDEMDELEEDWDDMRE